MPFGQAVLLQRLFKPNKMSNLNLTKMKKLNKSILVMAAILFVITANAQNKCTVNYGTNNYFTVKSSNNIVLEQKGNNVIMGQTILPKISPIKHETTTYNLTICPEDSWGMIKVVSLDYTYSNQSWFPDCLQDEVEEGEYEVQILGSDDISNYISTYLLTVSQDMEFTPTSDADATNTISVIGIDENGLSLSEKEIYDLFYDVDFYWKGSVDFNLYHCWNEYPSQLSKLRFNDLTEFDRINVYAWMAVNDSDSHQKHYFVEYPAIIGSDNINWTVENNMEDMKIHDEYFAITNGDEGFYFIDYLQFIKSETSLTGGIINTGVSGFNESCYFLSNEPIKMVTNIDTKNPNEYEDGEIKIKLVPAVFQVVPENDIEDKVAASSIYYDADGNIIREPFGEFESFFMLTHDNTPNYFESTPVSNLYLGKTSFYYGGRTPIAYFQSRNFNEYTSPYGYSFCMGGYMFIGESGCQRIGDQDATIKVLMDDEVVYYDNLYNYNMMGGYLAPINPCLVQMDIQNEHLVYDGVQKINHTYVEYDLHNNDATPPTMTILQVMDENNDEQVYLPNYATAHINFAAGDFEAYIHELYGFIDHMQYFAKPNVEVFYSIENGEWTSLEYKEDEAMFHPNYGNFFTIDLSQLDAAVVDNWVSLKFIVTDEAGNIQKQELSNVFYAGEMVSINEHTANSLQHTVYPNPFNGEVRITAAQAVNGMANIMVYNVLGEQVYNKAENCSETQDFTIDGSAWKPGVYFYSISTENGVLQGKIVKE